MSSIAHTRKCHLAVPASIARDRGFVHAPKPLSLNPRFTTLLTS